MTLTSTTKQKLAEKTCGICIICAEPLSTAAQSSIEHFIPRAIYKWIGRPNLKQQLESPANLFLVHGKCNFYKNAELPTPHAINALPVGEHIKNELMQLYRTVETAIDRYRSIKHSTLAAQKGRCAFCERPPALQDATLRRKNNHLERIAENAMCLCFKCSVRSSNAQYKHKMVAKKRI